MAVHNLCFTLSPLPPLLVLCFSYFGAASGSQGETCCSSGFANVWKAFKQLLLCKVALSMESMRNAVAVMVGKEKKTLKEALSIMREREKQFVWQRT